MEPTVQHIQAEKAILGRWRELGAFFVDLLSGNPRVPASPVAATLCLLVAWICVMVFAIQTLGVLAAKRPTTRVKKRTSKQEAASTTTVIEVAVATFIVAAISVLGYKTREASSEDGRGPSDAVKSTVWNALRHIPTILELHPLPSDTSGTHVAVAMVVVWTLWTCFVVRLFGARGNPRAGYGIVPVAVALVATGCVMFGWIGCNAHEPAKHALQHELDEWHATLRFIFVGGKHTKLLAAKDGGSARVPVPAIKLTVLVLVWWCGMISSTTSVFIYRQRLLLKPSQYTATWLSFLLFGAAALMGIANLVQQSDVPLLAGIVNHEKAAWNECFKFVTGIDDFFSDKAHIIHQPFSKPSVSNGRPANLSEPAAMRLLLLALWSWIAFLITAVVIVAPRFVGRGRSTQRRATAHLSLLHRMWVSAAAATAFLATVMASRMIALHLSPGLGRRIVASLKGGVQQHNPQYSDLDQQVEMLKAWYHDEQTQWTSAANLLKCVVSRGCDSAKLQSTFDKNPGGRSCIIMVLGLWFVMVSLVLVVGEIRILGTRKPSWHHAALSTRVQDRRLAAVVIVAATSGCSLVVLDSDVHIRQRVLLYAHQLTDAVGGMVVVLPTFIILALPIALVLNVRRPHANLDFRHPYLVYLREHKREPWLVQLGASILAFIIGCHLGVGMLETGTVQWLHFATLDTHSTLDAAAVFLASGKLEPPATRLHVAGLVFVSFLVWYCAAVRLVLTPIWKACSRASTGRATAWLPEVLMNSVTMTILALLYAQWLGVPVFRGSLSLRLQAAFAVLKGSAVVSASVGADACLLLLVGFILFYCFLVQTFGRILWFHRHDLNYMAFCVATMTVALGCGGVLLVMSLRPQNFWLDSVRSSPAIVAHIAPEEIGVLSEPDGGQAKRNLWATPAPIPAPASPVSTLSTPSKGSVPEASGTEATAAAAADGNDDETRMSRVVLSSAVAVVVMALFWLIPANTTKTAKPAGKSCTQKTTQPTRIYSAQPVETSQAAGRWVTAQAGLPEAKPLQAGSPQPKASSLPQQDRTPLQLQDRSPSPLHSSFAHAAARKAYEFHPAERELRLKNNGALPAELTTPSRASLPSSYTGVGLEVKYIKGDTLEGSGYAGRAQLTLSPSQEDIGLPRPSRMTNGTERSATASLSLSPTTAGAGSTFDPGSAANLAALKRLNLTPAGSASPNHVSPRTAVSVPASQSAQLSTPASSSASGYTRPPPTGESPRRASLTNGTAKPPPLRVVTCSLCGMSVDILRMQDHRRMCAWRNYGKQHQAAATTPRGSIAGQL